MPVSEDIRELYTRVDILSEKELDELPHGAIQLDRKGKILKYNLPESRLASVDKRAVIGKNFFTDVAPCTDVKEFHGRFTKGLLEGKLHEKFRYHFAFKHNPREVSVTLFYSDITDTVWVFVHPL
jgi:photoactive yellow protein